MDEKSNSSYRLDPLELNSEINLPIKATSQMIHHLNL